MKTGGFVYILASGKMGTLYIGSTTRLGFRTLQHKKEFYKGFTKKYGVKKLVYYEFFEDIARMVKRERQMKEWRRDWKLRLIIENNPDWKDLYDEVANEVKNVLEVYGYNGRRPAPV